MGLYKGKGPKYNYRLLYAALEQTITDRSTYPGKGCIKKKKKKKERKTTQQKIKEAGNKKISVKEAQVYPVFDSGACDI
jgi:hypothetical protein